MPFTAAHVMAVLPGVRWHARLRLDPTCLVIGSMAPDFEYFVRGELVSTISHTIVGGGLVVWNLPATLVLAVLWHHLVKSPLMTAMPRAIAAVFDRPWRATWGAGALVSLVGSALLGAATHIAWDAVTHANTPVTDHVAALRARYELPVVGDMVLHRILQHASTLVGLAAVAWYLARAIRRAPPPAAAIVVASRTRAVLVFAGCIAASLAAMAYRMHRMHIADPGSLIAGTISGVLGGVLIGSVVLRLTAARPR